MVAVPLSRTQHKYRLQLVHVQVFVKQISAPILTVFIDLFASVQDMSLCASSTYLVNRQK